MQLERFSEELGDFFLAHEHVHRYLWAAKFCKNARVLDIACGEGYGSNILANYAKQVVAVDLDEDALKLAKKKYSKQNLVFYKDNCTVFKEENSFDLAVSFETIEHLKVEDQISFLDCIKQSLKKDGIFIVSTPNKEEHHEVDNHYHLNELSIEDFVSLLKTKFSNVKLFGQRLAPVSLVTKLNQEQTISCSGGIDSEFVDYSKGITKLVKNSKQKPVYFIAVCSDKKSDQILDLESSKENSILFDNSFALSVGTASSNSSSKKENDMRRNAESIVEVKNELSKQIERLSKFKNGFDNEHKLRVENLGQQINLIQEELMRQIDRISQLQAKQEELENKKQDKEQIEESNKKNLISKVLNKISNFLN